MMRPAPFWTMLAAVWAFVLLGAAPLPAHEDLCATGPRPAHHHDAGCILCCACAGAVATQAILAGTTALPGPRGGALAIPAQPWLLGDVQPRAVPVRARGPPGVA